MIKPKTAEDLLPLVAELAPQERARLLHLLAAPIGVAAAAAHPAPARSDESTVDDLLSWASDGWENFA